MKKLLAMLLAMIMAFSVLTISVFAEPGDTDEEPDSVDTQEPAEVEPEEPKDDNPPTGIALMVLPMVMAGAAVAFSKKH